MKAHLRPVAAAISGALVNQTDYASVWDRQTEAWRAVSASVKDGEVAAFDHDRSVHITGTMPHAFHHGEQAFLEFTPAEGPPGRINGFDHGSQQHFIAEVRDHHVQIYDFDGEAFHAFTLSPAEAA